MMFACPGGCGKRHPLAKGQLVMENTGPIQASEARHYAPAIEGRPDGALLAVILCAPCTANIVRARAKVRT